MSERHSNLNLKAWAINDSDTYSGATPLDAVLAAMADTGLPWDEVTDSECNLASDLEEVPRDTFVGAEPDDPDGPTTVGAILDEMDGPGLVCTTEY